MTLSQYLRRAAATPPRRAVRVAVHRAGERCTALWQRRRDRRSSTYLRKRSRPPLARYFPALPVELLLPRRRTIAALAERAIAHQFNLLGSGRVTVAHGATCRGLAGHHYPPTDFPAIDPDGRWLAGRVNSANLEAAQAIWRLVDRGYVPIDWQRDFLSGYRWSEQTWSRDLRFGHLPGVDVKAPWELARMQHLPQLAWASALAKSPGGGLREPAVYAREFRNQILDFIATNPPRFGVNWVCTMDVAIRIANWLAAYDLFRADGTEFDAAFEQQLHQSVSEHARHIVSHFERGAAVRGNHYLANLVGLLFAVAYLPRGRESDRWLQFAVGEFFNETELQFDEDGGNFEASTCYHRLSAEMVAYGTALIGAARERIAGRRNVKDDRRPATGREASLEWIPDTHWRRLQSLAEFTMAVTRPDGRVVQVGDNDNGRFLKLWPTLRASASPESPGVAALEEDPLDHRHLLSALNGILRQDHLRDAAGPDQIEEQLVQRLCGPLHAMPPSNTAVVETGGWTRFPKFGLYLFRNSRFDLAFRCGSVGQNGNGGHAHNDQLSFVLHIDGVPCIVDPGTYIYTPLPEQRNRFRSTQMHNTLSLPGREQSDWIPGKVGLFVLSNRAGAKLLNCNEHQIVAEQYGFGAPHLRTLTIAATTIEGCDECQIAGERVVHFHLDPGVQVLSCDVPAGVRLAVRNTIVRLRSDGGEWSIAESQVSPAYGELVASHVCRLQATQPQLTWWIEIESGNNPAAAEPTR